MKNNISIDKTKLLEDLKKYGIFQPDITLEKLKEAGQKINDDFNKQMNASDATVNDATISEESARDIGWFYKNKDTWLIWVEPEEE